MKCRYCGKEIGEDSKFCAFCGKKAEAEAQTTEDKKSETAEPETSGEKKQEPETAEVETAEVETAEPETSEPETSEPETVTVKLEYPETVTVGLEDTGNTPEGNIPEASSGYGNDHTSSSGGLNDSNKKMIIILCSLIAVMFVAVIILVSNIVSSLKNMSDTEVQAEESGSVVGDEEEEDTEATEATEAVEATEEAGDDHENEGVQSIFGVNQDDMQDHNIERANGSDNAGNADGFSGGAVNIEVADGEEGRASVLEEGIHKYEVIIADVSWSEAFQRCIDRGGHLVCFNSPEEYNYVLGLIDDMNIDNSHYNLFIGGRRGEGDDYFWVDENGQCVGEGLTESCKNYWLPGEPSLHDDSVNVDEYCMDMLYKKKDGRWYWNDVTDDLIGLSDYFRGRMGYICEYQ